MTQDAGAWFHIAHREPSSTGIRDTHQIARFTQIEEATQAQHAALIRAFDDNELGKLHADLCEISRRADLGAMITAKLLRRKRARQRPWLGSRLRSHGLQGYGSGNPYAYGPYGAPYGAPYAPVAPMAPVAPVAPQAPVAQQSHASGNGHLAMDGR